jgi:hypothetical protein
MTRKSPPPAPPELVVIVDSKAGIRVRNGQVISIVEAYQADAKAMADLIVAEHAKIWPFYGVSEEKLLERTSKTKTMMGVGQRLDLSIFYKVTVPDEKLKSMVPKLRALKVVQSAYVKPGVELTIRDNSIESRQSNESHDGLESDDLVVSTNTPNFTQGHLNSVSEGGMGVPCAWAIEGGRGAGINIIDAEGAWNFSHEDLPVNLGERLAPTESAERNEIGWRNHGTAVLGVLGGDNNTFGITGICPEAFLRTVSVFGNSDGTPCATWSAGAAIVRAADNLNAGDILLLEHHLPGPRRNFETRDDQLGYIPIEWWPDNLAAIQYATDKGVIVVEAAGNGNENLNDSIYSDRDELFPDWSENPFARNEVDSKAIVVAAGNPPLFDPDLADLSREPSSNYGDMVDAQGWGDGVVTSGYGGLGSNTDENRLYTSVFNGTSSAAAMVAGAVGCLHGILRARGSAPLEPLALRALLRREDLNSAQQIGTFSGDPGVVRIGPRPNLCRLIAELTPPRPPGFLGTLVGPLIAFLRRLFK